MSAVGEPRVSSRWLRLREPADAEARSAKLVDAMLNHVEQHQGTVEIHDLGSGTGSMPRWLAPRLAAGGVGDQHWVLHDRDADLLDHAAALLTPAALGPAVTCETRVGELGQLGPGDLAHAGLVTASALLDMLTAAELDRVVATCLESAAPALLTLSVTGRVELTPQDSLDPAVRGAFNDHQRRTSGVRRMLGPDAVAAAVDGFRAAGADVLVRSSPWRLGPPEAALTAEWFTGWLGAARAHDSTLAAATTAYAERRLAQVAAGRLRARVHHADLLVLPPGRGRGT